MNDAPWCCVLQIDSWWFGQGITNGILYWDSRAPCYHERFPMGLQALRESLGVAGYMAHMGTWLKASPEAALYPFIDDPLSIYALPTTQDFWRSLLLNATTKLGISTEGHTPVDGVGDSS